MFSLVSLCFNNGSCFNILVLGNQKLRKDVESKVDFGAPDGIVINGLGPFPYSQEHASDGISFGTINVEPGVT